MIADLVVVVALPALAFGGLAAFLLWQRPWVRPRTVRLRASVPHGFVRGDKVTVSGMGVYTVVDCSAMDEFMLTLRALRRSRLLMGRIVVSTQRMNEQLKAVAVAFAEAGKRLTELDAAQRAAEREEG